MANCKEYETEKKHRTGKDSTTPDIPRDNRFHALTDCRNDDANTGTTVLNPAKPASISVYGVTSLPEMQKRFNEFLMRNDTPQNFWQMILLN